MRMKKPELKAVKFQEDRDVIATSAAALDWSILTISGLNADDINDDNTVTIGNKSIHYGETYNGKYELDAIYEFVFDNYDKSGGFVSQASDVQNVQFLINNSQKYSVFWYFDWDVATAYKAFNGSYRYQLTDDGYMFMPVTN